MSSKAAAAAEAALASEPPDSGKTGPAAAAALEEEGGGSEDDPGAIGGAGHDGGHCDGFLSFLLPEARGGSEDEIRIREVEEVGTDDVSVEAVASGSTTAVASASGSSTAGVCTGVLGVVVDVVGGADADAEALGARILCGANGTVGMPCSGTVLGEGEASGVSSLFISKCGTFFGERDLGDSNADFLGGGVFGSAAAHESVA